MGRKRTDFGAEGDALIRQMTSTGCSAEAVTAALMVRGVKVHRATVDRRMRELRGAQHFDARAAEAAGIVGPRSSASSAPDSDDLPALDGELPEVSGVAKITHWLALAEKKAKDAEGPTCPACGRSADSEELVKMIRLAAVLLDLKRKATPMPTPDPNENPDMRALAAVVAKRFHDLVEKVPA